jgi:hypothetical protein
MLVAFVASAGALFLLARRLDIGRPFAVLAVLLFGLSPLAVAFQRSVYLDNVATPWLIASFVFALSRRRHLGSAAAAAACFTVAVLSKETTLVVLPALAWQLWVNADPRTRRFVVAVFSGLLVSLVMLYPVFALLRNELLPGANHVSLMSSAEWQIFSRPSSGSIFDPSSGIRGVVGTWTGLDPWIVVLGVLAVPLGFLVVRLRPVTLALAIQLAMMLRHGYLPFPFVVGLLPFFALVVAGVLDAAVRSYEADDHRPLLRRLERPARVVAVAVSVVLAAFIVPAWSRGDARAMTSRDTSSTQDAARWVEAHVSRQSVVAVDDGIWVDLVEHGFPRDHVLWFYKVDLDPAVRPVHGYHDLDYLVLGDVPSGVAGTSLPIISEAIAHSTVVVEFGEGPNRISVRRVNA